MLKKIIKIFIVNVIKLLFPIKNNKIIFESFQGKYSDNPLYISESLRLKNTNLKLYWILENVNINTPHGINIVNKSSIAMFYHILTSKIILTNDLGRFSLYLTEGDKKYLDKIMVKSFNRKNQIRLSTWHGTPMKKMGIDEVGSNIVDYFNPIDTMILGDDFTIDVMKRLTFGKIKMIKIGSARNSLLFDNNFRKKAKDTLEISKDKKIALYAPTFRSNEKVINNYFSDSNELIDLIDIDKLLKTLNCKFGGEWVLIIRMHHHNNSVLNWDNIKSKYGSSVLNGSNEIDMSIYLSACDILISDCSSSIFDYMLTRRPIFSFFPDYNDYKNLERGLYFEKSDLPFFISENSTSLETSILSFNKNKYIRKVNTFIKKIKNVDDAESADKISNYILSLLRLK